MTIEEQEMREPTSFLKSEGTYRSNLIEEWVLEGTISSSATVAKYKDVVLLVNFYSKTKTLIGTERHPIYEYINPGRSINFKIKTNGFDGTESVGWDIESAEAAS